MRYHQILEVELKCRTENKNVTEFIKVRFYDVSDLISKYSDKLYESNSFYFMEKQYDIDIHVCMYAT